MHLNEFASIFALPNSINSPNTYQWMTSLINTLISSVDNLEDINNYKYKYALESSHIGVWEWDMQANRIHYSDESKVIHGYTDSELDLFLNDWGDGIHPEDVERLQKAVSDHINNVTPEYKSEHRILQKDGSYKWILDFGKIIAYDENNQPKTFVGTTIDITQRKEDEERLRQDLNIITNQNKKLSNFAHIVTHNLKEHAGNFESLLGFFKEANDQDKKEDILEHLITVSESLTQTIDNLRDIVSRQASNKLDVKPIKINQYINKVIGLLELDIVKKDVLIINKISDDLVLHSNETYLESIILNLASNALKYSHPDRRPRIIIDAQQTETELKITVEDNGLGIDLKKHGHAIFGLYNTFHNNPNSQGIGLYITKNQIEALGGSISVESTVNVGTTFTILVNPNKIQNSEYK